MTTMKHAIAFSVILLLGAAAAVAEPGPSRRFSNRIFNDVVAMTQAGLSNDTIVAYVKARRTRLDADVSAEDLIQLRQAGVSETVVRYIASVAGIEGNEGYPSERGNEATYDSRGGTACPVESSYGEDEAYGYGYPYSYGWYGYPYWYAYSPFFSGAFIVNGRFGRRGFDGGHFSGNHGFHGGGHSGGHGGGGHGHH